jgi:hypothetical protein
MRGHTTKLIRFRNASPKQAIVFVHGFDRALPGILSLSLFSGDEEQATRPNEVAQLTKQVEKRIP